MKRYYAETHEWIAIEDGKCFVGISDYAQHSLGDIVYVDLPPKGKHFGKGKEFGAVESVKTASDLYLPLPGTVIEVNQEVVSSPELINQDALKAWLIVIKPDVVDLNDLLTEEEYLAKHK